MSVEIANPFDLSEEELRQHLFVSRISLPELEAARTERETLRQAPQTQRMLERSEPLMEHIEQIPQATYTQYRLFRNTGERPPYQVPVTRKTSILSAAALRLFLGQADLKNSVQDYIWDICEETNWVWPAHERMNIDLRAAEVGFMLAELLQLLGETLDAEIRHRVRAEIERRIFDPYLRLHLMYWWYQGHNNWNGVCNSAVAATFLLLEPEPGRVARAVKLALDGLRVFLDTAFEEDGSSTEGVGYWYYGLANFVAFSEILYARSGGALNLLASERISKIAAYPARMQLSGSSFASFSDCHETVQFNAGIISRLAERSGEASLTQLLAQPAQPSSTNWSLTMLLRTVLWWDGSQSEAARADDSYLEKGGLARLVTTSADGSPVALALKAGHNAENHNHNDIGSFIFHVAGENLLTDPGPGLYSRFYFGPARYENIFANSYGHSVPRIGGQMQEQGRDFSGQLLVNESTDAYKQASIEFARAYNCADLVSARRQFRLQSTGSESGMLWLRDHITFKSATHEVEEALITWFDCEIDGTTALIYGQQHTLRLTIEQPEAVHFRLEPLEEQSKANAKSAILKRLSFTLAAASDIAIEIRMEILPGRP